MTHRTTAVTAAALTLVLAGMSNVHAQTTPSGRLLASNCFQCHGTNGAGPGFDRLTGESASEIYKELKEFQRGKEGNGVMTKNALGYTDAQLRALAGWLAQQR